MDIDVLCRGWSEGARTVLGMVLVVAGEVVPWATRPQGERGGYERKSALGQYGVRSSEEEARLGLGQCVGGVMRMGTGVMRLSHAAEDSPHCAVWGDLSLPGGTQKSTGVRETAAGSISQHRSSGQGGRVVELEEVEDVEWEMIKCVKLV